MTWVLCTTGYGGRGLSPNFFRKNQRRGMGLLEFFIFFLLVLQSQIQNNLFEFFFTNLWQWHTLKFVIFKFNCSIFTMDADLYDEFGNYIGPELESDSEDEESEEERPEPQLDGVRLLLVLPCPRTMRFFPLSSPRTWIRHRLLCTKFIQNFLPLTFSKRNWRCITVRATSFE